MKLTLRMLLLAALLLGVLPLSAQEAEEPAGEGMAAEPVEPPADPDEEFETMESILRDEERMLQGGYAYDPGKRRDPFVSLLGPRIGKKREGPRGECPAGCEIDEITLTGIYLMPEGPVAQCQSPDQEKSFLIRVGDEFYDGDVIAITASEVVFRQIVNDFQEMKPFREVTKKLNP